MPINDWTRVLFEAIDDAVFVHDEDGHILEANPAACRRLGYSHDELLKLTTREIDAPEFAEGFRNRLNSQLETGGIRCEGVHRTKDGRRIAVDINTSAIHLEGKPAVLAVMRDISQRKKTEEALAKQSQLLQSILDNMSDAIVVTDAAEQVIMFNPSAERIFGPGLVQGLFTLQLTNESADLSEFPIARCVRGESFEGMELLVRHEESPKGKWISVAGRPLREKGGAIKGGVLVCHDISTRKRDEGRLHAQYELARVIAEDRDFQESARQILQILCESLDFEAGTLWCADNSRTRLECLEMWRRQGVSAASEQAPEQARSSAGAVGLSELVWKEGEFHYKKVDLSGAPEPPGTPNAGGELKSVLAFPIHHGDDTIGVLELWSIWTHETDVSLFALLQAMANQIGQFLNRQQVEKELRDSRAHYESLVESLPQNIFRKDHAGRLIFGNQRFCATLRQPLSALLGKTDFDLFPAELAEKYVLDDQKVMQTGQPLDTVEEHHLPDGSDLYVHVVKTPVRDADDQVIGVQGIFWDVTQEVRANQAIAASEQRYRQLTEATMDGIVLVDANGKITLFNPAAERMFGYSANEVVGAHASVLVPLEFREGHSGGVADHLDAGLSRLLGKPHEFRGRRMDGTDFPVEVALSMLSGPTNGANHGRQNVQILAAIRDLTERNKMRAVLIQNEKLASIGLLSAGVAHEINNPLAFVANNLVVLERDCKSLLSLQDLYFSAQPTIEKIHPDLGTQIRELIDEMDLQYVRENLARILSRTRDGIERVTRIVHSLRGMARTEAPRRQETRLPDIITSSLEILHGNFKRLGVVVEQAHDENPLISCVPTQISQVVLNFLVNAFQAVEAAKRAPGKILVRTQRIDGEMLLEIKDNGTGIKPEHMARLFDPFFTTKDVGEGTGLGLSISHHIITAHGGRIEVESQPGEGTSFQIYLPLKAPSNQP